MTAGGNLISTAASDDEGGEIQLAIPTVNTTLAGVISIDVYQNKVRFFENGGTNRGAYIDITACADAVGTNLLAGGGGGAVWGGITGTVTDQTDLVSYISGNFYGIGNPSGYINATTARRQGIVDSIRSIINDAGIGFDGGGYYFLPLNAGALNNPVNNGEFTSTGKWFAVWDSVGASYLPALSVNVQSGISTITFPLTSYPPSGYGLFYTEDGGSTWYESTFKL